MYGIRVCSAVFRDLFFECLDDIAAYLTHFQRYDDPVNRAIWFRMLDHLLEIERKLPHGEIAIRGVPELPSCPHSDVFRARIDNIVETFNAGVTDATIPSERKVFKRGNDAPRHLKSAPPGFKSGLNSWQQYLLNDSPGLTVSERERLHIHKHPSMNTNNVRQAHLPPGALAVIQGNLDHFEELITEVAEEENDETSVFMNELEDNVSNFPSTPTQAHRDITNLSPCTFPINLREFIVLMN